jgi:excisionase family DNA binding protein
MTVSLSIPEAVKASGIGRTTLFDLIKTGRLPAKKLGARTIILRSDLEAFVVNLPSRVANK